jgi:hypothetical protein
VNEQNEAWERYVREQARALPYPPTPDIAGVVRRRLAEERVPREFPRWPHRRLVWATALLMIILTGLLSVPQVQASIRALLRIGAIELVRDIPTPVADATAPATTATLPARTPPAAILDLAGETSLVEAQGQVPFPIRLPTYPPDLGSPDRVYVQDLGGPAAILVWLDPHQPDQVQLSLHQLSDKAFGQKGINERVIIQQTAVNGQPAVWLHGLHVLQFYDGNGNPRYDTRRLVDGNVLIWTEGEITYRLETELPLEEAVRIAESLQ